MELPAYPELQDSRDQLALPAQQVLLVRPAKQAPPVLWVQRDSQEHLARKEKSATRVRRVWRDRSAQVVLPGLLVLPEQLDCRVKVAAQVPPALPEHWGQRELRATREQLVRKVRQDPSV